MFQPLSGKHGRSDTPTATATADSLWFQPLSGKHGRSDLFIYCLVSSVLICFNPSQENTAVLTGHCCGIRHWRVGFNPSQENTAVLTTNNPESGDPQAWSFNPSQENTAVLTRHVGM